MSSPEASSFHGPIVRFDPKTGNEEGIQLDQVALGENLQRDFPEITSDDWDRVTLLYRDMKNSNWGGLTSNLELLRMSKSMRLLAKAQNLLLNLISRHPIVNLYELDRLGDKADILVQINTKSEIEGVNNDHYSEDQPVDLATTTSHELKHAADGLLYNKANAHQANKLKKWSQSTARHLGTFVAGIATTAAGFSEYFFRLAEKSNDEVLLGKPFLVMLGGMAISAAPVIAATKFKSISYKRFGIERIEPPYAGGEDAANAYSVATRANWENVVYEKSQDALTRGV